MTRTAKMMMLSGRGRRRIGVEYEDYPRDYVEDKFRDRRGRERYDDGRFAPRSEMMEPYDRGYRRYSDGRFAPRSEYDMQDRYGVQDRYIPPVYHYPMYREDYDMQPIGFRDDRMDMHGGSYVGDELRGGNGRMMGHAQMMRGVGKMDRQTAEDWTRRMKNEDGTTGAHWTMEKAEQVMRQHGIQCEPAEFYAALNMLYSDFCEVFKKHGVNKIDFYADMAKAWLDDKDAVSDKLSAYYEYIVKH